MRFDNLVDSFIRKFAGSVCFLMAPLCDVCAYCTFYAHTNTVVGYTNSPVKLKLQIKKTKWIKWSASAVESERKGPTKEDITYIKHTETPLQMY